jgi:hypothetical protein
MRTGANTSSISCATRARRRWWPSTMPAGYASCASTGTASRFHVGGSGRQARPGRGSGLVRGPRACGGNGRCGATLDAARPIRPGPQHLHGSDPLVPGPGAGCGGSDPGRRRGAGAAMGALRGGSGPHPARASGTTARPPWRCCAPNISCNCDAPLVFPPIRLTWTQTPLQRDHELWRCQKASRRQPRLPGAPAIRRRTIRGRRPSRRRRRAAA